jgi:hypothetical protein
MTFSTGYYPLLPAPYPLPPVHRALNMEYYVHEPRDQNPDRAVA